MSCQNADQVNAILAFTQASHLTQASHTQPLFQQFHQQQKDFYILEFLYYVLAGATVGFAVGLTGVGGGSLMTPLLLLFGFPPHIAVGTDLLYATFTKASGIIAHHRQKNIEWRTVKVLALGSLPASLLTVWLLSQFFNNAEGYQSLITSSLGVMLILTSLVLIFKKRIATWVSQRTPSNSNSPNNPNNPFHVASKTYITFSIGIAMGVLVTLSSVGAGAICAAALLVLYPKFSSARVVGTDLAHAIPLTLAGGLGHLMLGNVDFLLLGALLVGSIPAIHFGAHFATKLPDQWLRPMLASTLLGLGIKYALF